MEKETPRTCEEATIRVVRGDSPGDSSNSRYQSLTAGNKLISKTLTASEKNFLTPPEGYRGMAVSGTPRNPGLFEGIESLITWRCHRRVRIFLCEGEVHVLQRRARNGVLVKALGLHLWTSDLSSAPYIVVVLPSDSYVIL